MKIRVVKDFNEWHVFAAGVWRGARPTFAEAIAHADRIARERMGS